MNPAKRTAIILGMLGGLILGGFLIAAPGPGSSRATHEGAGNVSGRMADNPPVRHAVTLRDYDGPRGISSGLTNAAGESVSVACATCHASTKPRRDTRSADQLRDFHQGMRYAHGSISCLSCHHEADYGALRLADGTSLPFADVMTLCGQCHGPQLRDYQRGLHGGMTGYWDLTRGPRTRNNCVHCHDPHAPDFPLVRPVFPPRDRIAISPPDTKVPHGSEHTP